MEILEIIHDFKMKWRLVLTKYLIVFKLTFPLRFYCIYRINPGPFKDQFSSLCVFRLSQTLYVANTDKSKL